MTTETVYKVLGENGQPHHGGRSGFLWPLPNGKPGAWRQVRGELVPCKHGLHLCRRQDLVNWLGPTIWRAEYQGEMVDDGDKIVVRKARLLSQVETWNTRTARLFAADCAERVVHLIPESHRGPFTNAIEVARRFARGEATEKERAAARAAAWVAASDASAWAAARVAPWDAARAAAWDAVWAAVWAAAGDAAGAAARAAARAAERSWQTERLFDYLEGGAG